MPTVLERLTRRKYVQLDYSELPRVLSVVDLTALGIGSTIGVGIYVLAGEVSKDTAGPAVVICFLIAAFASLLAGVCYAEFGARVPKAGSAYIYTYICVGEFVAFVIGWNLILEYVIGTASVASGYSGYIDELANNTISRALAQAMPIESSFLADYPNFLAFSLAFVLSLVLALGVKDSTRINNIFTLINLVVIVFVIISAGTQADPDNWKIPEAELNGTCPPVEDSQDGQGWGTGGFAPYGFEGIMSGAATCFFGFVGFDVIATTGEEAMNPSRSIPVAIFVSLFCIFIAYFGISVVITLVIPYCCQNAEAPLIELYEVLGWPVAKWFVSIGAIFGFSASLFGAMFPLPRVIYAMASDGLVFRFLATINKRFKTPAIATILSGLFAGVMAMMFDLKSLIDMMSIGTLMAYTIVAICVMLLRFAGDDETDFQQSGTKSKSTGVQYSIKEYMKQLFNTQHLSDPTDLTSTLVSYATLLFCFVVTLVALLLVVLKDGLVAADAGAIIAVVITALLGILILVVIASQPQSKRKLSFKVPFVPWIPALSSFINMYLMCNLSGETWIRFGVWMAIGFMVYFGYGFWKSTGDQPPSLLHGQDNLGFFGDKKKTLIIPTIKIHPATPTNSEPNTPRSDPKGKKGMAVSPLAQSESKERAIEMRESVKEMANEAGPSTTAGEVQIAPAATLNQTMVSVTVKDEVQTTSFMDSSLGDEGSREKTAKSVEMPNHNHSAILAAAVIAGASTQKNNSESFLETEEENSDVKINKTSNTNSVGSRMKDEELNDKTNDSSQESGYATIEEVMASESSKDRESFRTELNSSSVILNTALEGNSSQSPKSGQEPIYATVDKSAKKSAKPLQGESEKDENISSKEGVSIEDNGIVHTSHSVPALPSTEVQRPKSDGEIYHSVPTTPVTQRHPFKRLTRMSSFENIPPSSPDSPFARHIGNKFTIIPVQEPKDGSGNENGVVSSTLLDSDYDSSAPLTPHSGVVNFPDSDYPDQLMSKLLSKLAVDQSEVVPQDQGSQKPSKPYFSVGSTESLTSLSNGDKRILASDQTNTKDVKKVPSRESKLDVLDTIRERGESKIIHNDEEFHAPISAPSLLDISSANIAKLDNEPHPSSNNTQSNNDTSSVTGQEANTSSESVKNLQALFRN